jgi:hypothetical protein
MAKNEAKTKRTAVDPLKFIELVAMMQDITGEPPKMWGPSIIGFGTLAYKYASGREGVICLAGFSPRSGATVVYLGPGIDNDKLMAKLGKHKHGKGCLYINKLDDVDRKVLRKLIEYSTATLRKRGLEHWR